VKAVTIEQKTASRAGNERRGVSWARRGVAPRMRRRRTSGDAVGQMTVGGKTGTAAMRESIRASKSSFADGNKQRRRLACSILSGSYSAAKNKASITRDKAARRRALPALCLLTSTDGITPRRGTARKRRTACSVLSGGGRTGGRLPPAGAGAAPLSPPCPRGAPRRAAPRAHCCYFSLALPASSLLG